ncbi:hypothetical protein BV22DRAFT_1134031 [Leucogyrophana mollusca]|uniref:Uncharacterized protein n=1 Tax=Leucogyrophana mollusca TaxID=85980 RepID=A0ACB8B0I4_9AGAM|nr:hypothetical protein BV22DRAFT_1134031 [Leucogyrophana mollusca]
MASGYASTSNSTPGFSSEDTFKWQHQRADTFESPESQLGCRPGDCATHYPAIFSSREPGRAPPIAVSHTPDNAKPKMRSPTAERDPTSFKSVAEPSLEANATPSADQGASAPLPDDIKVSPRKTHKYCGGEGGYAWFDSQSPARLQSPPPFEQEAGVTEGDVYVHWNTEHDPVHNKFQLATTMIDIQSGKMRICQTTEFGILLDALKETLHCTDGCATNDNEVYTLPGKSVVDIMQRFASTILAKSPYAMTLVSMLAKDHKANKELVSDLGALMMDPCREVQLTCRRLLYIILDVYDSPFKMDLDAVSIMSSRAMPGPPRVVEPGVPAAVSAGHESESSSLIAYNGWLDDREEMNPRLDAWDSWMQQKEDEFAKWEEERKLQRQKLKGLTTQANVNCNTISHLEQLVASLQRSFEDLGQELRRSAQTRIDGLKRSQQRVLIESHATNQAQMRLKSRLSKVERGLSVVQGKHKAQVSDLSNIVESTQLMQRDLTLLRTDHTRFRRDLEDYLEARNSTPMSPSDEQPSTRGGSNGGIVDSDGETSVISSNEFAPSTLVSTIASVLIEPMAFIMSPVIPHLPVAASSQSIPSLKAAKQLYCRRLRVSAVIIVLFVALGTLFFIPGVPSSQLAQDERPIWRQLYAGA